MKLQALYKEDIQRVINPAVVVSEMDDYHVKQEIREYVFTPDLIKNLYTLLNALTHKTTGKTGVWVNGYYGSGKSHFIKYLHYCLDRKQREAAVAHFQDNHKEAIRQDPMLEPSPSELTQVVRTIGKAEIETDIFNIDVISKAKSGKEVISRIFLHRLNALRGYNDTNIALALLLEKGLDKQGKFEAFQERIASELGEQWKGNQNRFARSKLNRVIEIAREFDADLDADSLRHAIKNDKTEEGGYRIKDLINEFQDFLKTKGEAYRLVFLIDEVSQYIGSNTSLLLNLQSIIEEIGTYCNNQIWIVCTAQQELKNLINNTDDQGEDFGKILGRFETRISLESQSAAFITKKRILEKSPEGVRALTTFYKDNKGAIENQFYFGHDLYSSYDDAEDFYLTYPFVPYQFQLISDVFASFSQAGYVGEGVKNTERSILGITHFTARKAEAEEVGYFVPFDLFFNEQLEQNLTHFARGLISRAYNIKLVHDNPFARRVVNALFMISNLTETKRIHFPASLENLSLLLMNQVDQAKLELEKQAREILDELVKQNIIEEAEGKYRFLKEDEIEVANLIQTTTVNLNDKLDALTDDMVQKAVGGLKPKVSFGDNTYKALIRVDEKEVNPRGDFSILFSLYNHESVSNLAHKADTNQLIFCLHEWFMQDKGFQQQLELYIRTKKFITENASAKGARFDTIRKFGARNSLRLKEMQKTFAEQFLQVPVIIAGHQLIQPAQLKANSSATRYQEVLDQHLAEVYKKQALAKDYATSRSELQALAVAPLQKDLRGLTPAEEAVESRLTIKGEGITVAELIDMFEKPPYGWKDLQSIHVLMQLGKMDKRFFKHRSVELNDWKEFVRKAEISSERQAINIYKGTEISGDTVRAFTRQLNEIFNQNLISPQLTDAKEAVGQFQLKLKPMIAEVYQQREAAIGLPFYKHLSAWYEQLRSLLEERSHGRLIEQIGQEEDALRNTRDEIIQLQDFWVDQADNYREIQAFAGKNHHNFETLDEVNQQRGREMWDYFQTDDQPHHHFPQMKRAYKELSQAIDTQLKALKASVQKAYEEIYESLEAELKRSCEEVGVPYHSNLLFPKESKLNELARSQDITRLQLLQQTASRFEGDERKKIIDYRERKRAERQPPLQVNEPPSADDPTPVTPPLKQRTTHPYYISQDRSLPREIQSEEDLRAYLKALEDKLRTYLQQDKIILIQ